jgi:tetratricopeptide (TPR) repeat protein
MSPGEQNRNASLEPLVQRPTFKLFCRKSTFQLAHLARGRHLPIVALRFALLISAWLACSVVVLANDTPWTAYNEGVQAYAEGDYDAALQRWQDLSLQKLPRSLQRPVWFQVGNVHFRMGERLEEKSPEEAAELWRRSCEAYRSALLVKPRDQDVRHNLALVQRRLATLAHRLGMEAFHASEDKPLDPAIDLLRTSTEHLDEAANLALDDLQIRTDRDQAWQTLREKLKARAQEAETKADDFARPINQWANQQAEDLYRAALDDLKEARRPPQTLESKQAATMQDRAEALEQSVVQAEERVSQKLSQLLTRRGQQAQKEGDQLAEVNPGEALNHYESALGHYQNAQEAQPSNAEAQKGEREVRAAMEKLYVREGKAELERGKEALAQQSPRAAPALSSALSNYESALQLNNSNQEARAGAEEARKLLPEALNLAGRAELGAGDRAEPQSASDALGHYQDAEKDFRQSLELKPKQPPAEQGLKEAEEKLARVRKRAAEEAEAAAKADQPGNKPPKTLQSLLGQIEEKERTPELDRQRQRAQRGTGPRKYHADW